MKTSQPRSAPIAHAAPYTRLIKPSVSALDLSRTQRLTIKLFALTALAMIAGPIACLSPVGLDEGSACNQNDLCVSGLICIEGICVKTTESEDDRGVTLEDMTPITEDMAPVTEDMTPVTEDMTPITEDMTPITEDMTPVTEDMTPVTEDMTPVTEDMTPVTEDMTPVTEDMMPLPEDMTPASCPPCDLACLERLGLMFDCEADADCDDDGVLSQLCGGDDCDDFSGDFGPRARDQDCDGIPTAIDCDDTVPSLISLIDDGDCDGVLNEADCDDNDPNSYTVSEDGDCDGILREADCDDADPESLAIVNDRDCDGVASALDCDDRDETLGPQSADQDCDGVLTALDCDDEDEDSYTIAEDRDCDGAATNDDCDDDDPNSLVVAEDQDCDTVPTALDCDDTRPELGPISDDQDCDGVISALDCDDTRPEFGPIANDQDCDGVITELDCDDQLAAFGAITADQDCDGVVTDLDCDDTRPELGPIATDQDCDGVSSDLDCNDLSDLVSSTDTAIRVPQDVASLADAVNIACIGHTVQVGAGVWQGDVDLATKSLSLEGLSRELSTIEGEGVGSVIRLSGGTLSEVTIRGGASGSGGGVWVSGESTITDVLITGNLAQRGGGLFVDAEAALVMERVDVVDNEATEGGGVWLEADDQTSLVWRGGLVSQNRADQGAGLHIASPIASTSERIVLEGLEVSQHVMNAATLTPDGFANFISGPISVTGSAFTENRGVGGGVVFAGTPVLDDLKIVNNVGLSSFGGGATILGEATASRLWVRGNQCCLTLTVAAHELPLSGTGGAGVAVFANAQLSDSTFMDNAPIDYLDHRGAALLYDLDANADPNLTVSQVRVWRHPHPVSALEIIHDLVINSGVTLNGVDVRSSGISPPFSSTVIHTDNLTVSRSIWAGNQSRGLSFEGRTLTVDESTFYGNRGLALSVIGVLNISRSIIAKHTNPTINTSSVSTFDSMLLWENSASASELGITAQDYVEVDPHLSVGNQSSAPHLWKIWPSVLSSLNNENNRIGHLTPYNLTDTDGDGINDYWENLYHLDPTVDDTQLDPDADGVNNLQEFQRRAHPLLRDSDSDGADDFTEVLSGTDLDLPQEFPRPCGAQCPTIDWVRVSGGLMVPGSGSILSAQRLYFPGVEAASTELTVGQYRACVNAGFCPEPPNINDGSDPTNRCKWSASPGGLEDYPLNCVDWRHILPYLTWIGARLPTELEWEYIARDGGQLPLYVWGGAEVTCDEALIDEDGEEPGCGTNSTASVCSYPAGNSSGGICDLIGNIAEWTLDERSEDNYGYIADLPLDGAAICSRPDCALCSGEPCIRCLDTPVINECYAALGERAYRGLGFGVGFGDFVFSNRFRAWSKPINFTMSADNPPFGTFSVNWSLGVRPVRSSIPYCGNGRLDPLEECDLGVRRYQGGCSLDCKLSE